MTLTSTTHERTKIHRERDPNTSEKKQVKHSVIKVAKRLLDGSHDFNRYLTKRTLAPAQRAPKRNTAANAREMKHCSHLSSQSNPHVCRTRSSSGTNTFPPCDRKAINCYSTPGSTASTRTTTSMLMSQFDVPSTRMSVPGQ